jgi:hypothetical protein
MKTLTVPQRRFDLKKFLKAIRDFTLEMGGDEAFPIVQDGVAVFDADFCDMLDEDAEIPDDPVERLEAGHTLYIQFALCKDFDLLACADGTEIEVPDLDCEDDDDEAPLTQEQRELIANTHCDEKPNGRRKQRTEGRKQQKWLGKAVEARVRPARSRRR